MAPSRSRSGPSRLVACAEAPYVIGDFVWTGMDYLGESSIGNAKPNAPTRPAPPNRLHRRFRRPDSFRAPGAQAAGVFPGRPATRTSACRFPWFNCYCGDIDIIAKPKPQ